MEVDWLVGGGDFMLKNATDAVGYLLSLSIYISLQKKVDNASSQVITFNWITFLFV